MLDRRAVAPLRGVIFDLDGVLIDSLSSVGRCFNHALEAFGLEARPLASLRPLIGPPLEEAAAELLGSAEPERVGRFVASFRARYAREGIAETEAAPGLHEVVAALSERWPLAVATSKAEVYAVEILGRLGVLPRFRAVCGRSLALDGEGKAAVIERAIGAVFAGAPEGLVMVGDRRHDVVGAARFGVPTIGVLHGMGSREELAAAGAAWIVDDLRALPGLLAGLA